MKLEIMTTQFSVTYVTSGITLDILILALNNTKNLKNIHHPGTVQTMQWKYLSKHYLNKGLKTVLFGGPSETLASGLRRWN